MPGSDARPRLGRGTRQRLVQARSLFSRGSFEVAYFALPAFQSALDQVLSRREFDVVIRSAGSSRNRYRFRPARARDGLPRLVLDEHNIEFDLQRQMTRSGSLLRRVHNTLNWRKLRRGIADWRRFDGVTFTSTPDGERARALVPSMRSAVVPNAIDSRSFRPTPGQPPSDGRTASRG